jgi:hypothetical protein
VSADFSHDQPLPTLWEPARAAGEAQDCFADEIAIDFPSVDPLVERACGRFFGEPSGAEMLTTDVHVSKRAARLGTTLPLEVPLHGTCSRCGGRGEIWTEACRHCGGTGALLVHRRIRLSVPPGVADGARFRFRVKSPDAAPLRVEIRVVVEHP